MLSDHSFDLEAPRPAAAPPAGIGDGALVDGATACVFPSAAVIGAQTGTAGDDLASFREHLIEGDRQFAAGQFEAALARFQQALRLRQHPGCHYRLALAASKSGKGALAREHLQELVRIAPSSPEAHLALGGRYMEDGRSDLALQHSAIAFDLAPQNQAVVLGRAAMLAESGDEQAALELIRPMIRGGETPLPVANLYADIAPKLGQDDAALQLIHSVLDGRATGGAEAAKLHFRAATLLERRGRYDEAFAHARVGHDARRQPYDSDHTTRLTDGLIQSFSRPFFRSLPRATRGTARPVFIVGMPRSGTSLVEQILASHSAVYGAGELATLGEIACGLNNAPWAEGEPFPRCLELLSIRRANQLADRYLSRLADSNTSAAYVTDKLPVNARDLWLVQLLFPEARVIHCVRDPRDTCLSCYMTYFDAVNAFAQDLGPLGRFYRDHRRLMEHWGQVLDVPILDVTYEALVQDVEGHARRMLDFLGLEWDERCGRFHENPRHVATASRSQVRRPIYRSSVGRWKHYQTHLAPLLRELPAD